MQYLRQQYTVLCCHKSIPTLTQNSLFVLREDKYSQRSKWMTSPTVCCEMLLPYNNHIKLYIKRFAPVLCCIVISFIHYSTCTLPGIKQ